MAWLGGPAWAGELALAGLVKGGSILASKLGLKRIDCECNQ